MGFMTMEYEFILARKRWDETTYEDDYVTYSIDGGNLIVVGKTSIAGDGDTIRYSDDLGLVKFEGVDLPGTKLLKNGERYKRYNLKMRVVG